MNALNRALNDQFIAKNIGTDIERSLSYLGQENPSAEKISDELKQPTSETTQSLILAMAVKYRNRRESASFVGEDSLRENPQQEKLKGQVTLPAEKSLEPVERLDSSEKRLQKLSPETFDPKGLEATTGITEEQISKLVSAENVHSSAVLPPKNIKQTASIFTSIYLLTKKLGNEYQDAIKVLKKLEYQIPLENIFRFKPPLVILQAETWDVELIKVALRNTQGYLEQLIIEDKPAFDLKPLRALQNGFTLQLISQTLTLQLNSKLKTQQENIKLLQQYCGAFISYLFDPSRFTFQLEQEAVVIFSKDESLLANIKDIFEALQIWASLQSPVKESSLKIISEKVLEIEPLKPSLPEKKQAPPALKVASQSPLGQPILRPLPKPKVSLKPSSSKPESFQGKLEDIQTLTLFTTTLAYRDVFRRYRDPVLNFVEGQSSLTSEAFLLDLLLSAKTPLEKAILLEAVEWVKLKLTEHDERMKACRSKILISKSLQEKGKSFKQGDAVIQSLLSSYQSYLKMEIEQGKERESLQREHDACLLLLTALKLCQVAGKSWQERLFFNTLTEQQIYQQMGQAVFDSSLSLVTTLKKNSLKKLWAFIFDGAQKRLPLTLLEEQKKIIEDERQQQRSRYQMLLKAWQAHLSHLPPNRWKHAYLYGQTQSVHRFGGHAGTTIHSFFHISAPWDAKRFDIYEALQADISGLLGSTYFSQDKPLAPENTLCLDANYQQGLTGATADGYGHFLTLTENRKVHQTAYSAVKLITRYAALYPEAKSLHS